MMHVLNFLRYNNAVPVAISLLLMGGASAFAATNPDAVYSQTQQVLSIDNTYLVSKDLSSYSPRVEILGVTEDADNYYVAYKMYTIDLDNAVWKDVVKPETLTVSKAMLGQYRDLGVYVTEQLKENISGENRRLAETQEIEKKQVSQKVVATVYGGLIGKMLDETTETLPGYTPVVQPPPPPPEPVPQQQVAAAASPDTASTSNQPTQDASQQSSQQQSQPGAPTIQVLGGNPAQLDKGQSYVDLGAVITGPTDADRALGIHIFVNDSTQEVASPVIDTSKPGEWTITYKVTNQAGAVGIATRKIVVVDPYAIITATSTPDTTASTTDPAAAAPDATTSSAQSEPAPAPADSTASSSASVQ